MNGQPTTEFLEEIRQHLESGNIKNERKIRSADFEGECHILLTTKLTIKVTVTIL